MIDAYRSEKTEKRDKQDWLARAAAEEGHVIPDDTLDDSPDLREDLRFYLVAYQELSTIRPAAFSGVMPLPYDKVDEYAERYKLDPEETEDFRDIINGLDSEFRAFLDKESEKEPGKNHDGKSDKSNDRPGNVGRVRKGSK